MVSKVLYWEVETNFFQCQLFPAFLFQDIGNHPIWQGGHMNTPFRKLCCLLLGSCSSLCILYWVLERGSLLEESAYQWSNPCSQFMRNMEPFLICWPIPTFFHEHLCLFPVCRYLIPWTKLAKETLLWMGVMSSFSIGHSIESNSMIWFLDPWERHIFHNKHLVTNKQTMLLPFVLICSSLS